MGSLWGWYRPELATPKSSAKRKKKRRKRGAGFKPYAARSVGLRSLGFDSYAAYLASDLWAEIRGKVLFGDPACWICSRRAATQVHHLDYSRATLEGRNPEGLRPVCGGCHHRIELAPNGRKLTPAAVARKAKKFRRKAKRRRRREPEAPVPVSWIPRVWE